MKSVLVFMLLIASTTPVSSFADSEVEDGQQDIERILRDFMRQLHPVAMKRQIKIDRWMLLNSKRPLNEGVFLGIEGLQPRPSFAEEFKKLELGDFRGLEKLKGFDPRQREPHQTSYHDGEIIIEGNR